MPELPEVETIRRVLLPQLRGAVVGTVSVRRPEVVAHPDVGEFCRRLGGQRIRDMTRRGKFLTFLLESGDRFALHLRMTGCLLLVPPDCPEEKHTHVVLGLDNGRELRFADTRRFGRFWYFNKGEADTYSGMGKLGPEPMGGGLSAEYLQERFAGGRRPIKDCLLDQSAIAGIGNIYSDEILFAAGLRPDRPANSLSAGEWRRLAVEIPLVLEYFVEKNAITPEEYTRGRGRDYRNTPFLRVYGHGGEPCPVCGEALLKTVIAGRGSVYCPRCQGGAGG